MIARASDGSVRDALSILDKSLSLGEKKITEKHIQELLGLVDRSNIYLLFDDKFRSDSYCSSPNFPINFYKNMFTIFRSTMDQDYVSYSNIGFIANNNICYYKCNFWKYCTINRNGGGVIYCKIS